MSLTIPQMSRRQLLGVGAVAGLVSALPGMAWATTSGPKRLVFIIQRGAADGLSLVPPVGDPAFAALRGRLVAEEAVGTKLDDLFALHPALTRFGAMFAAGEAGVVHAVATAYRDRSHFDGQNILESGGKAPYARDDGWLNRLIGLLPPANRQAIGVAASVPLALRGAFDAANYAPSRLPGIDEDLMMRLSAMYAEDAALGPIWAQALTTKDIAGDIGGNNGRNGQDLGALAARLMTGAEGATLMMLETGGWDTHSGQVRRLGAQARGLDALLGALKDGLGAAWADTLVIVATEFGRTAAVNGTGGTDHGTAAAMLYAGGGISGRRDVAGGQVRTDWPGLGPGALYQDRDLKPTLSLEREIAALVAAHFGRDPAEVRRALYPDLDRDDVG